MAEQKDSAVWWFDDDVAVLCRRSWLVMEGSVM